MAEASVVVVVTVYGITSGRADLEAALATLEREARTEPGCRRFVVARALAEPDVYSIVQEWADEAAMRSHYGSPGYARYDGAVAGLLARPSDVTIHQVASTVRPIDSAPMDPRRAD